MPQPSQNRSAPRLVALSVSTGSGSGCWGWRACDLLGVAVMGVKTTAVRLIAALAAFVLFGCTNATTNPGTPTQGGRLTIALDAFDAHLLPIGQATTQGMRLDFMIFDRLVVNDLEGQTTPALAESITPDEKGEVWTIKLREGIEFSDGQPLTAEDVVYSFEFALDEANGFLHRGRISVIERMTEVDEQTVEFTLSAPLSSFADALTLIGIVPKHAMEPDPEAFAVNPIGSGPFVLNRFVPNDRVVLEANENYWAGAPSIDELVFLLVPDATTRLADLAAGSGDIVHPLLATQIDELESHEGLLVADTESTQRVDLWINNEAEPFDNKLVRQALSHAIDRQAIVDSVAPGSTPAIGPIMPSSWAFDAQLEGYTYDPQKAKALLAEAGYPDGVDFTLSISTRAGEEREAALIQEQAAAAGFRVKVSTLDYAALVDAVINARDYQAARLTATQTPDPDSMTYIYFYSDSPGNYFGYGNPEVDTLLDQGRATVEQSARRPIYSELQTILLEDAANVWLYYNKLIYGIGPNVSGFRPSVSGYDIPIKTNYGADVSMSGS